MTRSSTDAPLQSDHRTQPSACLLRRQTSASPALSLKALVWFGLLALALAQLASAQQKKGEGGNSRSVQGNVTDASGNAVQGAVVQLKNTKTLQIRSFITQAQGEYFFYNLSTDTDFELHAESKGVASATKTLSGFDNRKQAVVNLKLEK